MAMPSKEGTMILRNRKDPQQIPRYVISAAARLVGTTPHSLRAYEKAGLIQPARTEGNIRLYSDEDVDLLRHIQSLVMRGVNLVGIKVILDMEARRSRR
jgi:MerR family transcriptional regulator, heat shock protein HspR